MKLKLLNFLRTMLFVLFASFISWFSNARSLMGIDDANIYFIYMSNFANGHGFVYNIGGERVEGFTSFLWTLIGTAAFKLFSKPEIVLIFLNLLLISYALYKLLEYLNGLKESKNFFSAFTLLFLGVLFVVPGYFEWTIMSLMETGLWSCLLILISLNILTADFESGRTKEIEFNVLIFLLILTRPESMLWCLFFIFIRFLKPMLLNKFNFNISLRLITPSVFTYILTLTCLTVWRLYYFGFPVPNTFYAKVSTNWMKNLEDGVIYLLKAFSNNPFVALAIAFSPLLFYYLYKAYSKIHYEIIYGFGILSLTLVIPLYTGGDHFSYSRFLQPTLPLILLYVIIIIKYLDLRPNYISVISFLIFISLIPERTIYANVARQNSMLKHEWIIASMGRKNSEFLNTFFKDAPFLPTQGVATAGGQGYFYKGITNDLLGLNNTEMAHRSSLESNIVKNHSAFNKEVFYEQQPNLFWYAGEIIPKDEVVSYDALVILDFFKEVFKNIHEDSKFNDLYSAVIISKNNLDFSVAIFASNKYLEMLREMGDYEIKLINYK